MASGFKQATVNAADVPATQSNFPAYVDLSRIGITTQAEADSVRCYSDSGKTTELAREIVSATEMHVKIPSLTSTFTLYVDYDGARSDYLVTDTYGRNAVWSDYIAVWHDGGAGTDSTGNGHTGTASGGVSVGGATGQIGSATDYDGSNDYVTVTNSASFTPASISVQCWAFPDASAQRMRIVDNLEYIASPDDGWVLETRTDQAGDKPRFDVGTTSTQGALIGTSDIENGAWHLLHATHTDGAQELYDNGSNVGSGTVAGDIDSHSIDLVIGGQAVSAGATLMDGRIAEIRLRNTVLSANWITSEYNNQSDESGFWGTWTDVGGGATFIPKILSS